MLSLAFRSGLPRPLHLVCALLLAGTLAAACGGNDPGGAQGDAGQPGTAGASGIGGAGGRGSAGATGTAGIPAPNGKGTTDLFVTLGGHTQGEVDAKVTTAVNRFFGIGTGEPETQTIDTGYRCYYELPSDTSMAYIWAPDSMDVRSEGVSYGMMIAVQTDLHAQFDKLWKFAKTYMQWSASSGAWKYYFKWQGTVNGSSVNFGNAGPAPDGDEYFAAALYLADRRWGSTGTYNYKQEADNIATAMLHNSATGDGRTPIISTSAGMVVFYPFSGSAGFTDPSYHLPAFYEMFAAYGPAGDSAQWRSLASASRTFLVTSAHGATGLHPDYATFQGQPTTAMAGDGHNEFRYDAWRVVMNMAVDYAWFSASGTMRTQVEKYHAFFTSRQTTGNVTACLFPVDGSSSSGGGSTALTATLAAGALASTATNRAIFVNNLWLISQQSGRYRYYQEAVYLLGLLATAGKYNYAW
jgi:oligosaccharide reducing-end xylanase